MAMEDYQYFKMLGLAAGASEKDVRRAYYRLAKKYHPDQHLGDTKAEARFQEVTEAYTQLRQIFTGYYRLLDVTRGADKQQIRGAYERKLSECRSREDTTPELLKEVEKAYAMLVQDRSEKATSESW